MNLIALDIGNTNITVGLYRDNMEKFIETIAGTEENKLSELLASAWEQIPFVERATVKKRNGVIVVSSVNDQWTKMVTEICRQRLDEKIKLIGRDVPIPIETGLANPHKIGTDRIVSAAAAFAVVQDAVIIADFGTAFTIDLVDEDGVFLGGVIAPGFEMAAKALHKGTAKLPKINIAKPVNPIGSSTDEAMNSGLYYGAIGLLETVCRNFAEQIGKWPQVVVTGGAAGLIKEDCDFVDSWVPNLAVRGVVLAYQKYLDDQAHIAELNTKPKKKK